MPNFNTLSTRKAFGVALLALSLDFVGGLLSLTGTATAETRSKPLGQDDRFQLVFSEDFNAPTLNKDIWTTCYWWDQNGCTNLGSKNLNWYTRRNVSIEDGKLVLTARPEQVRGYRGRTFRYTSGMVTTGRLYGEPRSATGFDATYGFFEMRAKIPDGQGIWPAFWLLPSTLEPLPEIDIMEVLGHEPNRLWLHYHRLDRRGDKQSAGKSVRTKDLSKGWHVYGVDWSPEHIIWYLDGREVFRFTDRNAIPDEPMYIIINLAVGGEWPGAPDQTTVFPARMEIDYVRAWQKPRTQRSGSATPKTPTVGVATE